MIYDGRLNASALPVIPAAMAFDSGGFREGW
jgi:hypothetical protein